MQTSGVVSFKALGRVAQVSGWQIEQLRQGQADRMRVGDLHKLSQTLGISLNQLLRSFSEPHSDSEDIFLDIDSSTKDLSTKDSSTESSSPNILHLQQEYDRLRLEINQQRQILQHEFQQNCLRSLESWLIQFPTLVYAAQQNPQFPAKNFLPFIRPLEQLLQEWGVEAIAPVGAEVPYNPHAHQLLESQAEPGDLVKVRYTGYCQGERLLYRAKVSRVVVEKLNEV